MNLSIRLRLVAAGAIQLLVLLLVAAFGYSNLQQLRHADASHEHSTSVQNRLQVMQRGLGELILTEGSSASRQLTLEAVQGVQSELQLLEAATTASDTALGQTVRDVIVPQWQAIRASVEKVAALKRLSSEDVDAMQAFGKLSTNSAALAESVGQVVASAQASGEAAMDRLVVFASVGALVLMGVLVVSSLALLRTILPPLRQVIDIAGRVAAGEIGGVVNADHQPKEVAQVLQALGSMQGQLSTVVNRVREGADGVATSSAEIAQGNLDLSNRTEQAASKLQHTASSIVQLTQAVGHSAHAAAQASQLAQAAQGVAHRGGAAMTDVVSTMDEINVASRRIADIVGVIDGIAFQTNILALNAAVEAARAGEQGRGFAVVAAEVRSLAQRSAQAAREIKDLIGASVSKVESGAVQVRAAGDTMNEIVHSVQRVTDTIAEVTAASSEQSRGLEQVNTAVTDLDRMTQQNAALVEQSAAAAASLKEQATLLATVVASFKLAGDALAAPQRAVPPAQSRAPKPLPPPSMAKPSAPAPALPAPVHAKAAAVTDTAEEWASF